ncbi:hypothetical protein [Rubellicoccus peritrichatus]|uniref:Uncharacterized protein n=1 Tax=Rubellicoccus peritrichatus TaxID=3080537 RepID=A0AAQ3QWY0_9BACT|nr:hypothetical protein [Puniceicoccus sp. CR14]WOO43143.1 hypothetical protein RZN69_08560 [Puniceicoccus sp. CR14]
MKAGQIVIGIDPGKSGGLCALGESTARSRPMPEPTAVKEWLESLIDQFGRESLLAIIEEPPRFVAGNSNTGSTMIVLGENYGLMKGLIIGLGIPMRKVRPQEWQKGLPGLKGLKGAERKRALKNLANERFPQLAPTLKSCDAILIAQWGRLKEVM